MNETHYEAGDFILQRIGNPSSRLYKATIRTSPKTITMTGADVTTHLSIPFPHRWIRLTFFHMNSTYAALTNSELEITFKRTQTTVEPSKFEEIIYYDDARTDPYITARAGETYEYEPSLYDLILASMNTDLIQPVFYLQKLEQ